MTWFGLGKACDTGTRGGNKDTATGADGGESGDTATGGSGVTLVTLWR